MSYRRKADHNGGIGIFATVPTPCSPTAANLPPEIVSKTLPGRVVYLGSAPGSAAGVMIVATGAADPEGQALDYARATAPIYGKYTRKHLLCVAATTVYSPSAAGSKV